MTKTAGQTAFEADYLRKPLYHDGTKRRTWDQLGPAEQRTWEQNPTPRDWKEPSTRPLTNPIDLRRNDDGTWTLHYFGKEIGWIQKARGLKMYRALSVHGEIVHRASLESARKALMEAYH
jgi:hypothetical protein